MAGNLLMSISQDERERAVFRSRRMYQTDLQSNLATAEDRGLRRGRAEGRAEGLAEGLAEGRAENTVASIRNLMDSVGWSMEQAMSALKISEDDRAKYRELLNGRP